MCRLFFCLVLGFFFVWGGSPATVSADLTELVGGAAYTAEELWTKEASDVQGTISAEIEPHGARLYKLTEKGR